MGADYRPLRISPNLNLRPVIDGGSPRALRAWPLAWPSPSGPLGRQRLRRSRVGPEDRFCEAVRNNHAPLRGAAVGYENWVLASGGVCRSEPAGVFRLIGRKVHSGR